MYFNCKDSLNMKINVHLELSQGSGLENLDRPFGKLLDS